MQLRLTSLSGALAVCAVSALAVPASAEPRLHDGFYTQVSGGLGYYSSSVDASGIDQSISGMTLPGSVFLGGTLMPGLALGGGLFIDYASSPTVESGGVEIEAADISQMVLGLGVFADYYLKPTGGAHFQGFLGWGGLETSNNGNVGGSDPTGLIVSVAGGYDWWISSEWSAGVMGRLAYGMFSQNDVGFPTIAPALLGTLTYH